MDSDTGPYHVNVSVASDHRISEVLTIRFEVEVVKTKTVLGTWKPGRKVAYVLVGVVALEVAAAVAFVCRAKQRRQGGEWGK